MKNILSSVKYRKFNMELQRGRHLHAMNLDECKEYVCQNCGTHFRGEYCPQCKQAGDTKRASLKNIVYSFKDNFTSMDYAIIRTIFQLLYRPGYLAWDYLHGHRKEFTSPITLVFSLVVFAGVLRHLGLDYFSGYDVYSGKSEYWRTVYKYKELYVIVYGLIISFPLWILFKLTKVGKSTNLVESCYLGLYIVSIFRIIGLVAYLIMPAIGLESVREDYVNILTLVYVYIATKQYYKLGIIKSILMFILFITVAGMLLITLLFLVYLKYDIFEE